eukprot:6082636-Amphidinium_carterae.2
MHSRLVTSLLWLSYPAQRTSIMRTSYGGVPRSIGAIDHVLASDDQPPPDDYVMLLQMALLVHGLGEPAHSGLAALGSLGYRLPHFWTWHCCCPRNLSPHAEKRLPVLSTWLRPWGTTQPSH